MDSDKYDITPEMKVLKEVIYEYDNHIYYFKNLINEYEILKKEKEERFFSLCDHKWEKERENIPYGELYNVCVKCKMYKR